MNKMIPQLRFSNFTDEWGKRTLSEVLSERNNQQPQSLEYPLVSFTVENGVTPKTERYEREQLVIGDKSSKKYKVTELNDIVYNPANLKFGAIARNRYGNAVFSPIYVTFVVDKWIAIPEFMEMFVTRNDFIQRSLKYQQGTVYERQSVSPENLLSMSLSLPGKEEQLKIGDFFKKLDDTITLNQSKLDLLKEQKKGFLQKMFPKAGNNFPELRFEGFTDAWEQRKVQWFVDEKILKEPMDGNHGNKHPKNSDYVNSGIPFLMAKDIRNGYVDTINCNYITKERAEKLDKGFAKNGDVLITHKATIGQVAILTISNDNYAMLTPQVTYYRVLNSSRLSQYYLYSFFMTPSFQKNIKDIATQSTRPYIGITEQRKLEVIFPKAVGEQIKIGRFFKQLDEAITLQESKLDSLKEQKKAFLQQMFT